MGKESETHFDNMSMLAFDGPILLMGVGTCDAMINAM
jgi:hypothetical protein